MGNASLLPTNEDLPDLRLPTSVRQGGQRLALAHSGPARGPIHNTAGGSLIPACMLILYPISGMVQNKVAFVSELPPRSLSSRRRGAAILLN